ncbi:MAG: hypothetical protein H6984_13795 [Pseudomonadales bacterium]|nr:hypothetical protein [Halioglobus sp.]MCP5123522.1 hypothetical protein [Pseudomonadales bacterium]MCP5193640.1 hypothetical protein [Pseudomonadales bacterium]
MKAMIAIPALCLAMNAAAGCPVTHPREQPVIPDAAVASKQEMHRAQLAAEQYLLQGKAYLECGLMNRRQYSQLLSQLEIFSEQYNNEVIEYQIRRQMVAENDQAGVLPVTGGSAD